MRKSVEYKFRILYSLFCKKYFDFERAILLLVSIAKFSYTFFFSKLLQSFYIVGKKVAKEKKEELKRENEESGKINNINNMKGRKISKNR